MNEHILRLAREHAPCYLYFYEALAAQATALHDAFPGFGVLFSVKANPFPPVVRALASLGIGADGVPGYPLIEVYLTGKELRTAAEIDASVSDFMTTARLYCSGLNFTYNPHRLLLNKVTDVYLVKDGQRVELQDDKLYRIVADLYSGQMLSAVTDMSYGLLSIVPKYADGTPIEDFEDVILTENGKELKGWDAIARYMASFEDTDGDGIGNVPDYYSTLHDRKKVEDSRSLSALLKKPNRFTFILLGLILTVILLVVCLVLLLRKLVRKLRRRKKAR